MADMSMIPARQTTPTTGGPSTGQPSNANPLFDLGGDAPPPPGQTGSTTSQNFIGPAGYELPDTYRVNRPGIPQNTGSAGYDYNYNLSPIVPKYAVGDELIPLKESWLPERIAALQKQMIAAGLLKGHNFQLGSWDAPSMAAYRELLGYSNVSGQDSDTTLANFQATIAKFGDTTTGSNRVRQPFISELTDPNSLRDTLDAVSVRTMGRGLTEAEKSHFVDAFRATQEQSQRSKYDLAGDMDTTTGAYTGTGGSVTTPDPVSDATAYVKSTNPDAVKEYNYLNAFKAFQSLLSGSGIS